MGSPAEGAQLGRYQLERKLATGGMAEVFLAKARGPGNFEKQLVIKRILPHLAVKPDFVEMFLHEATLAAQLNHPAVAQIFDFGQVDGTYFLAMEYIDGTDLRSLLRSLPNRQLAVTLGAKIIAQACEGLAYAHEFCDSSGKALGLVHRDVSADNILIAKNGAVKVVDFGVAKVEGRVSKDEPGTVRGKIEYMPPEQIIGEPDLRSDVYALGVILYELAAGVRPYPQTNDQDLIRAIIQTNPPALMSRVPNVPVEFAMVVGQAMARELDSRYQSCRELASALEDFIAGTGERVGTVQIAQLIKDYVNARAGGTPVSDQKLASSARPATPSAPRLATPSAQGGPAASSGVAPSIAPVPVATSPARATGSNPAFVPGATPKSSTGSTPAFVPSSAPASTTGSNPAFVPGAPPKSSTGSTPAFVPSSAPASTTGSNPAFIPGATPKSSTGSNPAFVPGAPKSSTGSTPAFIPSSAPASTTGSNPAFVPRPSAPASANPAFGAAKPGASEPDSNPFALFGDDELVSDDEAASSALDADPSSGMRVTTTPVTTPKPADDDSDLGGGMKITIGTGAAMAPGAMGSPTVRPPTGRTGVAAAPPGTGKTGLQVAGATTGGTGKTGIGVGSGAATSGGTGKTGIGVGPGNVAGATAGGTGKTGIGIAPGTGNTGLNVAAGTGKTGIGIASGTGNTGLTVAGREATGPAQQFLADARAIRTGDAGIALAPAADIEALRAEFERDETVQLMVRLPRLATRLMKLAPDAAPQVAERLVGSIEGLLLTEQYGRLATLLTNLQTAAPEGDAQRRIFDMAYATFATADQVTRLGARLREAPPVDADGLGRLLPLFGAAHATAWLTVFEAVELPGSREALLPGLAALAHQNAEPFLARVVVKRPRRLVDLGYLLEKGQVPHRQPAFREILTKGDGPRRRDLMSGMARAQTTEALRLVSQAATGDKDEETRVLALHLLGKHFPGQVLAVVAPLVEPSAAEQKSAAERIAAWKAIGHSTQPEAFALIREVLKQKSTLLNRSKLDPRKVDALEGLMAASGSGALEILEAVVADLGQSDEVRNAARRHALAKQVEAPTSVIGESRRWERTPSTWRDVVLDLSGLAAAARLVDPGHAVMEVALARVASRLEALLKNSGRAVLSLQNGAFELDGSPMEGDASMERAARAFAARAMSRVTFVAPVPAVELQQLVRWLAGGPQTEGLVTPHVVREVTAGATERAPLPPVAIPSSADPSREAMNRYLELVTTLKAWVTQRAVNPTVPAPDVRVAVHELAGLMSTRTVRFLGLQPARRNRDAQLMMHANVMMVAVGFAAELGLPIKLLQHLATVALFSDVGSLDLRDEVLARMATPSPDDLVEIAASRRASVLFPFARWGDAAGASSWASVVVEQEPGPRIEFGLLGTIVGLARVYEALTAPSATREPMTAEAAAEVIAQKMGAHFRPELVPLFVRYVHKHVSRPIPR